MSLPAIDYRRTVSRPQFAELPSAVRDAVAEAAGSPVSHAWPSVTSGFTRGYAGALALADGRTAFAKAAGADAPHAQAGIERERVVLAALDGRGASPRMLGGGRGWVAGHRARGD